ncbi:MAG: mechanosensitive ion channel protein MscS [Marinilabiliales bacterium]|nr:MAG: mechanosensitive ion channel protein MscS [Marinilabiliales bacterium]
MEEYASIDKITEILNYLSEMAVTYGLKLLAALFILIIGIWVINMLAKRINKLMDKTNTDPSLRGFLKSLLSITLKLILFIIVLTTMGVEMTSFIAILGAASLAVGLALQGTLQNFAGGVIILLFKPYKVGDFIEAQGYMGTVSAIEIFVTKLTTPDNKIIIIPNGGLANSSLINYSKMETRRVNWTFGIAYGDSYDVAKDMIMNLIKEDERILDDPEPFIALGEMADSSVNITVRAWVKGADYWGVFFDMNENFYKNADKHNLSIPFPQMDVHLDK